MIFKQILNKDSGLLTRAKLNSMLSSLIEGETGITAVWVFLRSLEQAFSNLSLQEQGDVETLRARIAEANDYTDREINKLYTYVESMDGGVGGLVDSTSYDPSELPTDKAITLIALGAGTFTNLKDVTDTPITIEDANAITVFYRAPNVSYWNYKSNVITVPVMDETPTEGNTDHVVSSSGIYDFVILHGVDNMDCSEQTPVGSQKESLKYILRKNVGTVETPEYETVAEFDIPMKSLTKAGLLPVYVNGVFDASAFNDDSFTSLEELLESADTTVPVEQRRHGMIIIFRNATTGVYEQYRYLYAYSNTTEGNASFVDVANWIRVPSPVAVSIDDLDDLKADFLCLGKNAQDYVLVDENGYVCGDVRVISDTSGEKVTQIITTHCAYNDLTGTMDWTSSNAKVVHICRSILVSPDAPADTTWTRWNYVNNGLFTKIIDLTDGTRLSGHYENQMRNVSILSGVKPQIFLYTAYSGSNATTAMCFSTSTPNGFIQYLTLGNMRVFRVLGTSVHDNMYDVTQGWTTLKDFTAALNDKLNALPTATELTQQLTTIITRIATEENTRQNADSNLQEAISSEETRAKAAELLNANGISQIVQTLAAIVPPAASLTNKLTDKNYVDEADRGIATSLNNLIQTLNRIIPSTASAENPLTDKRYVDEKRDIFKATYGVTTFAEVLSADDVRKLVVLYDANCLGFLTHRIGDVCTFMLFNINVGRSQVIIGYCTLDIHDVWSDVTWVPIEGVNNKTSEIDDSAASEILYPSVKGVVDYVLEKISEIAPVEGIEMLEEVTAAALTNLNERIESIHIDEDTIIIGNHSVKFDVVDDTLNITFK